MCCISRFATWPVKARLSVSDRNFTNVTIATADQRRTEGPIITAKLNIDLARQQ